MSFIADALPAALGGTEAATAGAGAAATAASGAGGLASLFQSVATPLTLAGGLLKGYGQIQSAEATKQAALFQSQVAANNAQIANQNASWATAAGEAQVAQSQMQTRANVGGIKAAQAAANVDVNSGSALDVQSSARDLGELSALTLRSNAARQAYGFQTQSGADTAESQLQKSLAGQAIPAGILGAASTALSTAGQIGGQKALQSVEGVPGGPSLTSSASSVPTAYQPYVNPGGSSGALLA